MATKVQDNTKCVKKITGSLLSALGAPDPTQVKYLICVFNSTTHEILGFSDTDEVYVALAPNTNYTIAEVVIFLYNLSTKTDAFTDEILYSNGGYWLNVTGTDINPISEPSTYYDHNPGNETFRQITYNELTYQLMNNLMGWTQIANSFYVAETYSFPATDLLPEVHSERLTLKECGVWRLKNEHAFNQTVSLYDILGELVEDYTIEAADEYLDMEIGVDGTYYIEVFKEGESFGDNPSTDFSIPIFSYCGVRKCLKALISDIICVDECSEPCDGKTSVKRATISRITALMYLLDRYIFVERDKFYNTMLIDTERREFMGMISKIGIALKSIVNRCGECGDTTTTSSGCNGCQ